MLILSDPCYFRQLTIRGGWGVNPIRSGGGGALKAPLLRIFAPTHLILELHYCAFVTFPKK